MKLLFYISSMRGGGAERVMAVICNNLVNRGYDIYLATNKQLPMAYELNENIKLIDLYIPRTRNRIKNAYKYLKRIRSIAKEVNPDIIISFVWPLTAMVIPATFRLSIPIVASEHFTFDKKRSLYESFVRLYLNRLADRVTILTQYDNDYLGSKLPRKVVVPNPLPYEVYERDIIPRNKNILAIGSIDRWYVKGFDTLIKIWKDIAPYYPDWTLDIAGTGSESKMNDLKTMALKYNVSNSIRFLGFQNEIDKVMRRSSIFVLSSRNEGFAMVLAEAISQGCACASFDCKAGPREIIVDKKSGLLVEDQNLNEMKKALVQLIENEELRNRLSIEGREEAKKFNPDVIVDKWEVIFKQIEKLT